MNTKIRIVLCLWAVIATLRPGLRAADKPPPRTTGRVLVLENERILEGDIERQGDQYRMRRSVGETWLPADQVLCLCANMEEAYTFLRNRANLGDPDERLRLARWCQLQGLRSQALAEVTAAVELRPRHAESLRLLHHLQSTSSSPVAAPAGRSEKSEPLLPVPKIEVNAESLGLFATRVQPILMNTCAHCHATDRGGPFKLIRVYEGDTANHRATQRNLAAVLTEMQKSGPQGGLLLSKAVSIHGGAEQAPLKSRQMPAYRTLEEWVRMAAAGSVTADSAWGQAAPPEPGPKAVATTPVAPAETPCQAPSEGRGQKAEGRKQKAESEGQWAVASEEAKGDKTSSAGPVASTQEAPASPAVQHPTVPVDWCDPLIFNRQMHASPGTGN